MAGVSYPADTPLTCITSVVQKKSLNIKHRHHHWYYCSLFLCYCVFSCETRRETQDSWEDTGSVVVTTGWLDNRLIFFHVCFVAILYRECQRRLWVIRSGLVDRSHRRIWLLMPEVWQPTWKNIHGWIIVSFLSQSQSCRSKCDHLLGL